MSRLKMTGILAQFCNLVAAELSTSLGDALDLEQRNPEYGHQKALLIARGLLLCP